MMIPPKWIRSTCLLIQIPLDTKILGSRMVYKGSCVLIAAKHVIMDYNICKKDLCYYYSIDNDPTFQGSAIDIPIALDLEITLDLIETKFYVLIEKIDGGSNNLNFCMLLNTT